MNISLTPEIERVIQAKISTGMYANASEVIRDAIRHLDEIDPYKDLRAYLVPRIMEAEQGQLSTKNMSEIIAEAKANKGK